MVIYKLFYQTTVVKINFSNTFQTIRNKLFRNGPFSMSFSDFRQFSTDTETAFDYYSNFSTTIDGFQRLLMISNDFRWFQTISDHFQPLLTFISRKSTNIQFTYDGKQVYLTNQPFSRLYYYYDLCLKLIQFVFCVYVCRMRFS